MNNTTSKELSEKQKRNETNRKSLLAIIKFSTMIFVYMLLTVLVVNITVNYSTVSLVCMLQIMVSIYLGMNAKEGEEIGGHVGSTISAIILGLTASLSGFLGIDYILLMAVCTVLILLSIYVMTRVNE